jgi:hypothetical protein
MRIPVYTAEGRVTREAPGRSIRARQSIQQVMAAEEAKAAPASALAESANEYAKVRYKIETENNLNEALLDAQEALRERRKELEKAPNYHNVLDGDDPIWTRETQELKNSLLDKVGRDQYALQQFNSRFGQLELQNRFALRDGIDRRIQIAAEQNRVRKLQNGVREIANGTDLAQLQFVFSEVEQDTNRLAKIQAGNYDILTKQQLAMLKEGARLALEKNANEAESGISFVDEVRAALRDKTKQKDLTSPQAAYMVGLLSKLDPSDQVAILRSVGGDQVFIEGKTTSEITQAKIAEANFNDFQVKTNALIDRMEGGEIFTYDDLQSFLKFSDKIRVNFSDEQEVEHNQDVIKFAEIFEEQKRIYERATLNNIDAIIAKYRKGKDGFGIEGVADTEEELSNLKMAINIKDKLTNAMSQDGDPIAWASVTKMDQIKIEPIDTSVQAIQSDPSQLINRIEQGRKIKALNDLDFTPVFSKAEVTNIVSYMEEIAGPDGVAYLQAITSQLDQKDAQIVLNNLNRAGLSTYYIQSMYISDPAVQKRLIELKDLTTAQIKETLPSSVTSGSVSVSQLISNNSDYQDYSQAYVTGGDGDASIRLLNEQTDMIERLSYSYIRSGISTDKAVEKAISDIFVGNIASINGQGFIIPTEFNADDIEDAAGKFLGADILARFDLIPLADPRYGEFENLTVSSASLTSNGVWLNNSTGDGVVLHYNLNGAFIPALTDTADPKRFEIKFKDLQDFNFRKFETAVEENEVINFDEEETITRFTTETIVEPGEEIPETRKPALADDYPTEYEEFKLERGELLKDMPAKQIEFRFRNFLQRKGLLLAK